MLILTRKSDERIWIKKEFYNKLKNEVGSEYGEK